MYVYTHPIYIYVYVCTHIHTHMRPQLYKFFILPLKWPLILTLHPYSKLLLELIPQPSVIIYSISLP